MHAFYLILILKCYFFYETIQKTTYKSLYDFAEYDVFSVEPPGPIEEDVELRAVRILSVVSHGDPASGTMTQQKLFIIEFLAIDTLT